MALNTAKAIVTLRGLTAKFDNRAKAATPWYPNIALTVPSEGLDEKYAWLGNMPGMREWLGDRVFHELRAATYELTNKHWENSVAIKKTDIEDDRLTMYGPLLEMLADEATHHPDELMFDLVVNGHQRECFDGQNFFDTDHVWGESGTQSNALTYNANDHTAVTPTEFKAAFHAARQAMLLFKRDNGKFFHRPKLGQLGSLICLVPAQLEEAAVNAMKAIVVSATTNIMLEQAQIVPCPFLTNGAEWYLFHTGGVLKPFIFQARAPLSRKMKGLEDMEFKDVKFMTEARYNAGYLAWWNAVKMTFN